MGGDPGAASVKLAKPLTLLGVLVALMLVSVVLAVRFWPDATWKPRQQSLEQRYGIRIVLDDVVFPESTRRLGVRYRTTLGIERSSVLSRLELDLSRYPAAFVARHVREIVVLRSLEIAGYDYGGTYDVGGRRIYLVAGWLGDDGSRAEAMGLHHEFSSLLMRQYPRVFSSRHWRELNPPGYRYRHAASSFANLSEDSLDLVGSPEMWTQGFLCGYGMLTLEDDINTFAQYLVARTGRWPALARDYPPLTAKMDLLTRWYCEIGFSADGLDCPGAQATPVVN